MTRTSFEDFNCSAARALDILGDKWTMLVIRDAFYGVSTFSEFRDRLGIARNVLTDRLEHLVRHDILERKPVRPGVDRHTYRLTERGKALFPVLIALVQWGDKWLFGSAGEPVQILDREARAPVQPVGVLARDGRYLAPRDVVYAPGPGATDETLRAFEAFKRKAVGAAN
jgi:DNA-binding HxlR family transcriptional regulator